MTKHNLFFKNNSHFQRNNYKNMFRVEKLLLKSGEKKNNPSRLCTDWVWRHVSAVKRWHPPLDNDTPPQHPQEWRNQNGNLFLCANARLVNIDAPFSKSWKELNEWMRSSLQSKRRKKKRFRMLMSLLTTYLKVKPKKKNQTRSANNNEASSFRFIAVSIIHI